MELILLQLKLIQNMPFRTTFSRCETFKSEKCNPQTRQPHVPKRIVNEAVKQNQKSQNYSKLKLDKGASFFVKTQLRRLRQEDDTWEATCSPFRVRILNKAACGGESS